MLRQSRRLDFWPVLLCFFGLLSVVTTAQTPEKTTLPLHLEQARKLVKDLRGASLNVYGGGKRQIVWEPDHCSARTVCSSFATLLLQHAYGWTDADYKAWMGSTNPKADRYHDAIVAHNGFEQVQQIEALRPGDYLALKYTDHHVSKDDVENTGHVMLVAEDPHPMDSKNPVVPKTRQYEVSIIDSTASGHGPTDTRAKPAGGFTGGIGQGVFRLYVNESGKIVGYAWSTSEKSEYFTGPARDIVAGHLTKKPTATSLESKPN